MKPEELIKCINASCKKSISPAFNLSRCSHNYHFIHFVVDGTSYAVNNKEEQTKVLNWFDDFWLFLEIKFRLPQNKAVKNKNTEVNISLSVFHGKDTDNKKHQLLRAEWDDYDNPDEKYAQPHWHITSNQTTENIFIEYTNEFDNQDFLPEFDDEKPKMIDVKRIHFAMNGDWQNNGKHVHRIENEQQVVSWLQGMLNHLRAELENL